MYRAMRRASAANLASVRFVANVVPFIAKLAAALGPISQLGGSYLQCEAANATDGALLNRHWVLINAKDPWDPNATAGAILKFIDANRSTQWRRCRKKLDVLRTISGPTEEALILAPDMIMTPLRTI